MDYEDDVDVIELDETTPELLMEAGMSKVMAERWCASYRGEDINDVIEYESEEDVPPFVDD